MNASTNNANMTTMSITMSQGVGSEAMGNAAQAAAALLVMVVLGMIARALGAFANTSGTFEWIVFRMGIPALAFRALAKSKLRTLNWTFALAFLALRAAVLGVALLTSIAALLVKTQFKSDWPLVSHTKDVQFGTAKWKVREAILRTCSEWINFTWLNTIVFGIPIVSAIVGPQLGQLMPVLASLSSFFFQLPLLLVMYELGSSTTTIAERKVHRAVAQKRRRVRRRNARAPQAGEPQTVPAGTPPAPPRPPAPTHKWIATAWQVLKNPPLIACIVGLFWGLSEAPLPLVIDSTMDLLGSTVTPLACIDIGVFTWEHRPTSWHNVVPRREWQLRALFYILFKMLVLPAIAWGILQAFGLDQTTVQVGVIVAAMPVAVSAFVFSRRFDTDANVAAATVIVTTILTLPFVIMWIAATKPSI